MNMMVIKGRISSDLEVKKTQTGKSVINFSVAVDSGYGDNKTTDFFRVVAWNKTADFVGQYFVKGQEILINGEMHSRDYENKDGQQVTVWELLANTVEFCGSKQTASEPVVQKPAANKNSGDNGWYENRQRRMNTWSMPTSALNKTHSIADVKTTAELDNFTPVADDHGDLPFT